MTAGGKRMGSGRKNTGITRTKSFRLHDEWLTKAEQLHGRKLNNIVDNFIKSLTENKL